MKLRDGKSDIDGGHLIEGGESASIICDQISEVDLQKAHHPIDWSIDPAVIEVDERAIDLRPILLDEGRGGGKIQRRTGGKRAK